MERGAELKKLEAISKIQPSLRAAAKQSQFQRREQDCFGRSLPDRQAGSLAMTYSLFLRWLLISLKASKVSKTLEAFNPH